ncbi:metallophosphoesterase [Rufibacter immobilis]|uniref:metallophosphoesterase n=1 Tax=Rufibacter immobilis TaxID=1348778 RepID=UPI001C8349AD|nr:metallophosphoesterase [Rufibacter immobilis]
MALVFCLGLSACKSTQVEKAMEEDYFQIVVLPDTQYYTSLKHGGTMEMFEEQIKWIKQNQEAEKIAYVAHVGDIVDHGRAKPEEWDRASAVLYQLEAPTKNLPHGIPYGVAVGNHDQTPNGNPTESSTQVGFEQFFGRKHFETKPYYGGAHGPSGSNDNHYDLFSAGGQDFLVLYLEYNEPNDSEYNASLEKEVHDWAEGILTKHANRKTIIVSHSILARPAGSKSNEIAGTGNNSTPSKFTPQGKSIYERFKKFPNVFMMLSGHRAGEGFRREEFNGNVIKAFLADYQSRTSEPGKRNGGNGLVRLMKFDMKAQTVSVRTIAPRANGNHVWEEDEDSKFTVPLFK